MCSCVNVFMCSCADVLMCSCVQVFLAANDDATTIVINLPKGVSRDRAPDVIHDSNLRETKKVWIQYLQDRFTILKTLSSKHTCQQSCEQLAREFVVEKSRFGASHAHFLSQAFLGRCQVVSVCQLVLFEACKSIPYTTRTRPQQVAERLKRCLQFVDPTSTQP